MIKSLVIGSFIFYYVVGIGIIGYHYGNDVLNNIKHILKKNMTESKKVKEDIEMRQLVPLAMTGGLADIKVIVDYDYDLCD